MEQIPVISLNLSKLEANPGFHIDFTLLKRLALAGLFGDVLMRCVYRMRPYEIEEGSVEKVHAKWVDLCIAFIKKKHLSLSVFNRMCREMIKEFDAIPIHEDLKKPRVGIVGEILVKFSPAGNNHLVELLESEGSEAVVPDLADFMLYCFYNQLYKHENLGTPLRGKIIGKWGIRLVHALRSSAVKEFSKSAHFVPPSSIYETAENAKDIVSIGNQTGEGWFLTGEMLELISEGVPNIVCTQPFGCLPNHVVGKGVIKELRHRYPSSNIVAIDYDPGASEVNQLNRIKLMLSTAYKNL